MNGKATIGTRPSGLCIEVNSEYRWPQGQASLLLQLWESMFFFI